MELWTPEHAKTLLPAVVLMLLAAVGLRAWLGKKPLAVRMIPLQICTCILLVLEVGKQVLSLRQGYDLYHLPFPDCSLFIFVMPLMAFYRGHHRQQVTTVSTAICAAVFMLMMIYANYYSCNIPILETVRLAVEGAIGPLVAKLVYIAIVSALNILFTWGVYLLYRLSYQYTKLR